MPITHINTDPPLNLYLLQRRGYTGYEENRGFLVRAKDARIARRFVADYGPGADSEGIWELPAKSAIRKIGVDTTGAKHPQILLIDAEGA
jgi:hypothetical protein